MQKIKIKDLNHEHKERIKCILPEQKQLEWQKATNRYNFFLTIFIVLLGLFLKPMFEIAMKLFSDFNIDYLYIIGSLSVILGTCATHVIKAKELERNRAKNDFYIIYGHVDNKTYTKEYSDGREIITNYYYIIEGNQFEVARDCFKNFNFQKIPVGEYRYLLSRENDNLIRKDVTEYFEDPKFTEFLYNDRFNNKPKGKN